MAHRLISCLLILLTANIALTGDDTTPAYLLHLSCPDVKGHRNRIEFVYARLRTIYIHWDGRAPRVTDETRGCHLIAQSEILNVTPAGHVNSASLIVESFTQTSGGPDIPLLPPGTHILCSSDGKYTHFTIDGHPPDSLTQFFLLRIYSLPTDDPRQNSDRLNGTLRSRHIGENWPIDPKAYADGFRANGNEVAEENLAGQVQLLRIEPVDGDPCFHLHISSEAKSYTPPGFVHPPANVTLKDASSSIQRDILIPVDVNQGARLYIASKTNQVITSGRDNQSFYTMDDITEERWNARHLPTSTTQPTTTHSSTP